jgi:hypothetical protein
MTTNSLTSVSSFSSLISSSKLVPVLEAQTIFLTGATGFLGKVLLHKLLNTCRNVRVVYVLIRGKKGLSAADRLDRELLSLPVFDEFFTSHPHLKERIKVVDGDISKPYLGLSSVDRQTLEQNVTLILHCAATTKFMENLRVRTTTKRQQRGLISYHTIRPNHQHKNTNTFFIDSIVFFSMIAILCWFVCCVCVCVGCSRDECSRFTTCSESR